MTSIESFHQSEISFGFLNSIKEIFLVKVVLIMRITIEKKLQCVQSYK